MTEEKEVDIWFLKRYYFLSEAI